MRIILQTTDGLLFLAGDGRVSERMFASVGDFTLDGELEKQIVRKVRGSHALAIARGNVKHRAFFRTRRLFPTAAEAEDYAANAERSFPRTGTLYFWTGRGTRKLMDAVLTPPITKTDGCLAMLQYQAQGGDLTPLEPGQVIDGLDGAIFRFVEDATAKWFEIGFESPMLLDGSAETGWMDPDGFFLIRPERSVDLVNWDYNISTPAGTPEASGADWTYWARLNTPLYWKSIITDLTATTNRYGKSITDIKIGNVTVSLPNYPYAMPGSAATLQTDLRAAGYTGAVVSNVSAALSIDATNYVYSSGSYQVLPLPVTLSGSNVTLVKTNTGTNISLPGYPYSMPSQLATLQADLRAAGQSGATVRLYGDAWTVFLPDRPAASPTNRQYQIVFTPDDPHPEWDFFGTYLGNVSDNTITGTSGNIRPGVGSSTLTEASKQFARLKLTAGPNYLY
jgi:hypothetical protein